MLGKGLIRLEAKIRRGTPRLPVIPLQLLVYTPKGNITAVGNYLQQCNLLLDHPSLPYDDPRLTTYPYFNPHNPPPGGHPRPHLLNNRLSSSRWDSTQVKSQDVQKAQIEEVFKHLKDGVELPETEPTFDVATKLYPHQKKALTFLLDRERERPALDGEFSSLWRRQLDPMSQRYKWVNLVTEETSEEEPKEAKGSILADDMGLGKTITCVSLIAATLQSAKEFATQPVEPPQPPPPQNKPSASHFAGSVWGMPEAPPPTSTKAKKAERTQEKLSAEYVRACRIKARSRATLIICPLSTVANWEEQFREHWRGEVSVVGGSGNCICPATSSTVSTNGMNTPTADTKPDKPTRPREGNALRVYIYHGNARRPDPTFLSDFDAVITTFATLASEFSKQSRTAQVANEDGEDTGGGGSSDGGTSGKGETGQDFESQAEEPKTKKGGTKRKKPMTTVSSTEIASPLQSVHWFRVVLDEAHSIKETQTVGCRASCDLIADRRLCLTGTPVQNKLDDMFALIKFLRLKPFDDKNIWTKYISAPAKFGQREGVLRLRTIMACITLRRTKESKTPDGNRILALPPRHTQIIRLSLNPSEKAIYDQYYQESKEEFTDLSMRNQVMKNYVGILQRLLRLRQICDHKDLIAAKDTVAGSDSAASYDDIVAAIAREGINPVRASAIFAILKEAATTQCIECGGELCTLADGVGGIVNDDMDADGPPPSKRGRKTKGPASRAPTRANSPSNGPRPVLTRCQHLFCLACYKSAICPGWPEVEATVMRPCSACQTELSPADAVEIKGDMMKLESDIASLGLPPPNIREQALSILQAEICERSSKIKSLIHFLLPFSLANPHSANYNPAGLDIQILDSDGNGSSDNVIKTVVFSQWTSMLDKIEDALLIYKIRYDRLDGTMKREERSKALDTLKYDPGCEVLLVSLKAGGVGLNLTAAQKVILMDPCWNPAVENQAIDRIHRLGQTKPVLSIKYIIQGSIEESMLKIQERKNRLAQITLGARTKAEIMEERMEQLKELFK
ncbi:hypothetical protein AGABI1DRAFT_67507 [Agaricus bisporus var. burnettii JB137-S8]|uniref:Uncharacterized protein n=1 Tax=Agaricus bisporus var. burnettii (strain JB137-S8 / ATCC MYA-4627 / FGSC 10392) TaxID=597362 RepID=K5XKY8_AGABU|nr:uncharacterized protein AGABI1DRAFT_67507 [Agaricus bisporus var. burnettii JB137-S8]EKM84208.1 hypothetical protein AGABI1DRAFT_67507 [Agaricus bisporus var. burnettii JB137-S8]